MFKALNAQPELIKKLDASLEKDESREDKKRNRKRLMLSLAVTVVFALIIFLIIRVLPSKVVEIDVPTTAENIAEYLLQHIINNLPKKTNVTTVGVRIYETEKTYAERTQNLK